MAIPMMMGSAISKVMAPVTASACKMPTAADALWRMLVNTTPTRMPRMGLEKLVRMRIKASLSRRGDTAPDMEDMPYISTAKPSRISPTCRLDALLLNIRRIMPITATTPVSTSVLSSCTTPLPPSSEDRHRIHPVTLVPTMAPIMTPMACRTFIIPEFTKPTTITEVAEEDWITAVTPVPSRTPFSGVLLSLYSTSSNRLPATFFSPSPIRDMPNRNSAIPPSSVTTSAMPIAHFLP